MFYELLSDNTIGCSTLNKRIAKSLGLTLETDKEIVYGYDGKRYFKGEEPAVPEASYAEKRAAEYPPMGDYCDAMIKINSDNEELIKEGKEQLKNYIEKCLAVKKKYPK